MRWFIVDLQNLDPDWVMLPRTSETLRRSLDGTKVLLPETENTANIDEQYVSMSQEDIDDILDGDDWKAEEDLI